eukprot:5229822-Prymnesium_polylepis.4
MEHGTAVRAWCITEKEPYREYSISLPVNNKNSHTPQKSDLLRLYNQAPTTVIQKARERARD